MHARSISAALCLPLLGGLAVATAPQAAASAQCSLSAPGKVSISRPYTVITLRASGACTHGTGSAAWDGIHSYYGPTEFTMFEGTSIDRWEVYDFEHLGTYTWRPASAYDSGFNPLSQNTVRTVVRLRSYAGVHVTRSGSRVTVTGYADRYGVSDEKRIRYARARAVLQYRTWGGRTWHRLKTVHTNRAGRASYSYRTHARRHYRTVVSSTRSVWGSSSATKSA